MTKESKIAIQATKVANIILSICELYNVPLQTATDIYYMSATADMIERGIADLNCRSDKYLATLVWEDYLESIRSDNSEGGLEGSC